MSKIILITILLAFTSPVCFAKGGGHKHLKKIFEQLDLSPEQKKSLKSLRDNKDTSMKDLREKKKSLKNTIGEAMMSDASEAKLRSLHTDISAQISSIQSQIKTKRFEKMLKIRSILAPEQRKTFFEMKKKMKKGKGRHKHHSD